LTPPDFILPLAASEGITACNYFSEPLSTEEIQQRRKTRLLSIRSNHHSNLFCLYEKQPQLVVVKQRSALHVPSTRQEFCDVVPGSLIGSWVAIVGVGR
jgi:hypothetical protein